MVGGRSHGCRTCKQRRIKCDERIPVCLHCEKSKRICTGFASVFVYEYSTKNDPASHLHHAAHQTYQNPLITSQDVSDELDIIFERFNRSDVGTSAVSKSKQASQQVQLERHEYTLSHIRAMSPSGASTLSSRVIHAIQSSVGTGVDFRVFGDYVLQLPAQVGHSQALDSAVACLLQGHSAIQRAQQPAAKELISMYAHALRVLRYEISGGQKASIATLSAVILLSDFEVGSSLVSWDIADFIQVVGKPSFGMGWKSHARGTLALIRALGPQAFDEHLPRVILLSQVPILTAIAIEYDEPGFLNQLEWATVLAKAAVTCKGPNLVNVRTLELYARLPRLYKDMNRADRAGRVAAVSYTWEAWFTLSSLRYRVLALILDPAQVRTSSTARSGDIDSALHESYYFTDLRTAETFVQYWKLVLIIHGLMVQLSIGEAKEQEGAHFAAHEILKVVEYARCLKPLASWFMAFSLPMVAKLLPEEDKYVQDALHDIIGNATFDYAQFETLDDHAMQALG